MITTANVLHFLPLCISMLVLYLVDGLARLLVAGPVIPGLAIFGLVEQAFELFLLSLLILTFDESFAHFIIANTHRCILHQKFLAFCQLSFEEDWIDTCFFIFLCENLLLNLQLTLFVHAFVMRSLVEKEGSALLHKCEIIDIGLPLEAET